MATLVEAHDTAEFALAGKIGAELIGINNRDLHTFMTDIAVTERLLAGYKGDALIVTESGIDSAGRHSAARCRRRARISDRRESAARRYARREAERTDGVDTSDDSTR